METLKIGDQVLWRGGFGMDDQRFAEVVGLTVTEDEREKYGKDVEEVEWEEVLSNHCVVSLDNGHWAYGEQIRPASWIASVNDTFEP